MDLESTETFFYLNSYLFDKLLGHHKYLYIGINAGLSTKSRQTRPI